MDEFNLKLINWAEKAVNFCHNIATDRNQDFDLSFYAFQNLPKENPEILFLGINPGGEAYPYSSLYENKKWGLINDKKMTTERFVKENPMVEEMQTWKMWKNLENIFRNDKLHKMYDSSMKMNLIYFNTPNISDFLVRKNATSIFNKNKDLTIDLILNIIKPKNIICLGTAQCFDKLSLKNKEILLNGKKRLLTKGNLENIPVYGIPHPSGSYTSYDDLDKISLILNDML